MNPGDWPVYYTQLNLNIVWCLITTDSFSESVLKAVNLGDDTDTVGAVTGGLAGLYYGYGTIPTEWVQALQRMDWIEDLLLI